MFGAPPAPTFGSPQKGGRMSFGGIRGRSVDDEDEDDGGSVGAIGLANGSITLDQVSVSMYSLMCSAKASYLGPSYHFAECMEGHS
jgi:hypothetical protein